MKNTLTRTWPVLRTLTSLNARMREIEAIDEIELTDELEAEYADHKLMVTILQDNPNHYD